MWLDQDLLKISEHSAKKAGEFTPKVTAQTLPKTAGFTANANAGAGVGAGAGAGAGAGVGAGAGMAATAALNLAALGTNLGANLGGEANQTPGFQLSGSSAPAVSETGAQAAGYAKGFAAGWAAGQRRAQREASAAQARVEEENRLANEARTEAFVDSMDRVASLMVAIQERDELVVDEMKDTLATAALQLATALLGAELRSSDNGARAALTRALSLSDPKEIVRVRMNPADIAALEYGGVESPVDLVADSELEPGDAISELPEGFLDARLSAAISRAQVALEGVREAGGELQ